MRGRDKFRRSIWNTVQVTRDGLGGLGFDQGRRRAGGRGRSTAGDGT